MAFEQNFVNILSSWSKITMVFWARAAPSQITGYCVFSVAMSTKLLTVNYTDQQIGQTRLHHLKLSERFYMPKHALWEKTTSVKKFLNMKKTTSGSKANAAACAVSLTSWKNIFSEKAHDVAPDDNSSKGTQSCTARRWRLTLRSSRSTW